MATAQSSSSFIYYYVAFLSSKKSRTGENQYYVPHKNLPKSSHKYLQQRAENHLVFIEVGAEPKLLVLPETPLDRCQQKKTTKRSMRRSKQNPRCRRDAEEGTTAGRCLHRHRLLLAETLEVEVGLGAVQ